MKCTICGNEHEFKCPMVKALDFYPDGRLARVEYVTMGDFAQQPTMLTLPTHATRQ
jgi:hypothetical protein